MRLAALVIACLLVISGSLLVLIFGFLALTFQLGDLLVYLAIAGLVLLLVRAAGQSLDRQFNRKVDEFITGSQATLSIGPVQVWSFGIALITLILLLVYLEALALDLVLVVSNALISVSRTFPVTFLSLILPWVFVVGAIVALVTGLLAFVFPSRAATIDARLAKTEHPQLWALLEGVAQQLHCRPIDHIVLTLDPGIEVTQSG